MMHRGWIGQPLLAKRKLLPMHLPPARDGPEHETRKARRAGGTIRRQAAVSRGLREAAGM